MYACVSKVFFVLGENTTFNKRGLNPTKILVRVLIAAFTQLCSRINIFADDIEKCEGKRIELYT